MGAREKLNVAYLNGSLVLAAVVGVLAQSWPAFFLTLIVLLSFNLYRNEIRPHKPGRRDGKR